MDSSYDYPSESIGSTSSGLLQAVRVHDQAAWVRLVWVYGPLVRSWCRAESLQDADVADVFQDVFRAVADNIDEFQHDRPGDTFRGWLRTITRNRIYDLYRRTQKEPQARGGSDAQEWLANYIGEMSISEGTTSQEASALFRRILHLMQTDFSDRVWQAFWRTAIDGATPSEVGDELNMSSEAVRQAKSRVLRRLRDELGGQPDDLG